MRLTWLTDVHLDFITNPSDFEMSIRNIKIFCGLINNTNPDGIIISGDISRAHFLKEHLLAIEEKIGIPIYFVLGNHDFWDSSIDEVRNEMTDLSNTYENINYLSSVPFVELTEDTVMVGHDGWYDALYSDPRRSNFIMNDWMRIRDYSRSGCIVRNMLNLDKIVSISRQQATIAANHVANGIRSAIAKKNPKRIIVVTHVPPFTQPLRDSKGTAEDCYPWYSSKIMGNMLLSISKLNPNLQFEVFCGHCHSEYEDNINSNIVLHSGGVVYSEPLPQKIINI